MVAEGEGDEATKVDDPRDLVAVALMHGSLYHRLHCNLILRQWC